MLMHLQLVVFSQHNVIKNISNIILVSNAYINLGMLGKTIMITT